MLNRLYIVVGVLAIIIIGAAFVLPRFIDWGAYRGRLEALASDALGTPVAVKGAIDFTLLPQPKLSFSDVEVGEPALPFVTAASVEATFSLMDFMRDRYAVTALRVISPRLNLSIDGDGWFSFPVSLADTRTSNVSIADASIVDGMVRLADARSDGQWSVSGVNGDVRLSALRGPFAVQGTGVFAGETYTARINSSELNAEGMAQLSLFVRPEDGGRSFSAEGVLTAGSAPAFEGTMIYRQAPAAAAEAGAVRGDLLLTSKLLVSPDKILLSNYTLHPDETQAGTRLSGAAVVQLGAAPGFDAVISGGVVALAPRDAREETGPEPFELIRLIEELPAPNVPAIPGRIGVDIAELNLRAFSLRDVRFDAISDGEGWTLEAFEARLPGDTRMVLSGGARPEGRRAAFAGQVAITSGRLDALSQLWRKAADDNPLFNIPGSMTAGIVLDGEALRFSDGRLSIAGATQRFSGSISLGGERRLGLVAGLGTLGEVDSAALFALLPPIGAGSDFAASFPSGDLDIRAGSLVVGGLPARELRAAGSWDNGQLTIERLAAQDYGGARLEWQGGLAGGLKAPSVTGSGRFSVANLAAARLVDGWLESSGLPKRVQKAITGLGALSVALDVTAFESGAQKIGVKGTAGAAALTGEAGFVNGFGAERAGPVMVKLVMTSDDPDQLAGQLGFGPVSPVEGDQITITLNAEGAPDNSLETDLKIEGGADLLRFAGNVIVADPGAIRGKGRLEFELSDPAPLADLAGVGGVFVPDLSGVAVLGFDGTSSVTLTDLVAEGGGVPFTGSLSLTAQGEDRLVSGGLTVDRFEAGGLGVLLGGPAALLPGVSLWPDGPLAGAGAPRASRGRVRVSAPVLRAGGGLFARNVRFDLVWDRDKARLQGLTGSIGGGTGEMDLSVCCAGIEGPRQVSGRVALNGVALAQLVPGAISQSLSGTVGLASRFEGSGVSMAEIMAGLTGEGSLTIAGLTIEHLDPHAFARIAELGNILDLEPEDLAGKFEAALDSGRFTAAEVSGVVSIAGGQARASNLVIAGAGARLFGGMALGLGGMELEGNFDLTPTGALAGNGLISETTARVGIKTGGTLFAPVRKLDLAPMADAIKVAAYELEVARLEKLRAEDEARAKAAAEERARILEEQARIAAQETARLIEEAARAAAIEEAARKAAAEKAARQAAEDAAARALQDAPPIDLLGGGSLTLLPEDQFLDDFTTLDSLDIAP